MKLGTLFIINAVVAVVFGLAFFFAPVRLLAMYGVTLTSGTLIVSRLLGAALLGYGLLTWQARTSAPSDVLHAIVVSLTVGDAFGFAAALRGQLAGGVNSMGWSTVVVYGALAAGFGYFSFRKQGAAVKS